MQWNKQFLNLKSKNVLCDLSGQKANKEWQEREGGTHQHPYSFSSLGEINKHKITRRTQKRQCCEGTVEGLL